MTKLINIAIFSGILVGLVAAAEPPSLERGKELFNSAALGTNGKSCSSCHVDVNQLKGVAGFDDEKLDKIINQCIQQALKGKALPPDSSELKSLAMYLRSLTK